MKKSYINPTTNVTLVETQYQVLAGSIGTNASGEVENVSMGGEYSGDASGVLSRGRGGWDDED